MTHTKTLISLAAGAVLTVSIQAAEVVKVYILAGQSNMEGKAQNKLLEYQAKAPETKKHYTHLRKDGQWITRDDVMIKYLKRHGGLTIGYGSRDRTGAELQFGTSMGDHHKEPVLLIKTAWGGHSLFQKFRSPSAGMPSDEFLAKELAKAVERAKRNNEKRKRNDPMPTMKDIKAVYGSSYRMMMEEVKQTYADYETLFPSLKGKKLELAGFVWFQGWNDQYNGAETHYASNMKHFINDVRKDLKTPKLPFVIGVMGQNGSKPAKGAMKVIQDAQLSMETLPDFKGNVKAVKTDVLIDKAAEKLYPTWKQNFEQWEKTGSDRGYHYLGSAIWFNRIGKGFAEAMIELQK
ncbi:MAG: sialate O-acetylesterase [Akkermansiaceae bacterium]